MAVKERTPQQLADAIKRAELNSLDKHLRMIEKRLENLEPLIEARNRLQAARRAILNERATTAGGGKGITQAEVVNEMSADEGITVSDLAKALGTTEAVVRGHLNRGKDERFQVKDSNGVKVWFLREPEEDDQEDDDDD